MNNPVILYQQRIDQYSREIRTISSKLMFIPWLRLFLFLAIIGFICFFTVTASTVFIVAACLAFTGFLLAGWYDYILKQKRITLETRIGINKNEIDAIQGNYSVFEPGSEFLNESHPYTHDLDIFGQGSLFQYVNRSSTLYGKKRLAGYFTDAYRFRDEIIKRQQAIKELSREINFRQELQSIFFEKASQEKDLETLIDWLDSGKPPGKDHPGKKRWDERHLLKVVSFAGPAITLVSIIAASAGLIPYQAPVLFILLQLLVVFSYGKKTMKVHQKISSQFRILQKYAAALSLIENTSFQSVFIRQLQAELKYLEKETPSTVIKRFSELLNWMDSNLNILVSVILNGLLMFNIHLLLAVEDWRIKYRELIPKWFSVLAEFDALSGLAALAFNNPGFVYPEVQPEGFTLVAEKMGHPLIPRDRCVKNDIRIMGWKQFYIITGANMSGKSTFLRTIGTNTLLAMMGAPVFAEKFIFTPVEIHSSIRTNDSLVKRESYFYAELKRLKEIIGELESGRRMLILLDEILKGTNSSDKQSGSIALVRQLMNYSVVGLFATHDVAISGLQNNYPENISNLCFEISIEDDHMEIDYQLRPGVCKNLNASYLMKKMGIVLE
jgi:DNA mismatch repair ATPase MutS